MEWRASLVGQVRQTHLPKWKSLLPLFEAVMNAIQAINEGNTESPHIGINIHREKTLGLDDNPAINGFTITDNGVGFHDNNMERSFDFTTGYDPNDVSILPVSGKKVGTSITLRGFSDPWKSEVPSDIDQLARRLCEHFILVLMDEDCPKITITDGAQTLSVNAVFKNNFRSQSNNSRFEIRGKEFSVISFRISEPRSSRNRIVYCADNRAVMT